jgi:hypothetical protein
MTIREALLSMCYREVQPGHWMKPIGFQSLTYHEGKNEWCCWFLAANDGSVSLWESKAFEHNAKDFGSYLDQLKNWECYTRTSMNHCYNSEFHLRGIDFK